MSRQSSLFSAHYADLQSDLHERSQYGVASTAFAGIVAKICKAQNITSLCDYGAGRCRLNVELQKHGVTNLIYNPYDPAFPEYGPPVAADLVCCIDVFEHIEPAFLEANIEKIFSLTINLGFFSISTVPAQKTLKDGRNAHLIQENSSWWLQRLTHRFDLRRLVAFKGGFWMIVRPLKATAS